MELKDSNGKMIEDTGSLVYLGGLLVADGRADSEVSRRIGAAAGDFRCLQKVWSHAGVSRSRKIQLFCSIVVSKLQYGLATLWMTMPQRRRLDGFCARCLRRILRIPAAFISRVSNASVYDKAGMPPMSVQVLRRQLLLLGRTARAPAGDPLRVDVFVESSLRPQVGRYVRRLGRPRQDWTTEVMKAAAQRLGSFNRLTELLQQCGDAAADNWKTEVEQMFART